MKEGFKVSYKMSVNQEALDLDFVLQQQKQPNNLNIESQGSAVLLHSLNSNQIYIVILVIAIT